MEAPADGDDAIRVWQPRDRLGWRHGVVFSGSADLLTAWHAARLTMPGSRAATDNRFGVLVDRIRQARLGGSLDEVESACRALLDHVASHPAPVQMRQAVIDLREVLTWVTSSAGACLLGGGCLCVGPVGSRWPRHPAGDHRGFIRSTAVTCDGG